MSDSLDPSRTTHTTILPLKSTRNYPKCILLAPVRSGRRFSRVQSRADLVNSRIVSWAENKSALWQGVLSRSQKSKSKPLASVSTRHHFEKRVLYALRANDATKAIQMFTAAPIAPKSPETFQALKELHCFRSSMCAKLYSLSPQPQLL